MSSQKKQLGATPSKSKRIPRQKINRNPTQRARVREARRSMRRTPVVGGFLAPNYNPSGLVRVPVEGKRGVFGHRAKPTPKNPIGGAGKVVSRSNNNPIRNKGKNKKG